MPDTDSSEKKREISPGQAIEIVWDVGVAIALPTVLFALGGRWLDRKYQTTPLFLGLGLVFSLVVSGVIVFRLAKRIAKRL